MAVQEKNDSISPAGNRTPVSRVTGEDTHHYTTEDLDSNRLTSIKHHCTGPEMIIFGMAFKPRDCGVIKINGDEKKKKIHVFFHLRLFAIFTTAFFNGLGKTIGVYMSEGGSI